MARTPALPPVVGTWSYLSGTAGAVTVPSAFRVLQVTASAPSGAPASLTINGGSSVVIPAGKNVTIEPKGNLNGPLIVFSGTDAYFIELVR